LELRESRELAIQAVVQLPGFRSARDPSRSLKVRANKRSREYVAGVQRERLIDAVVQVVVENGYESAHIKVICQRAGVGLNTFYEHFRSKEQLFLAAYDAGVGVLFRLTSEAYLEGQVPWRKRVEAGLGAFLQTLADNPLFARYFVIEIHKAGDEGQARVDGSIAAAAAMFTNVQPAPGLNVPADELVPIVVGAMYERIYVHIREGKIVELPQLLPVLTEFAAHVFTTADFGPAQPQKGKGGRSNAE